MRNSRLSSWSTWAKTLLLITSILAIVVGCGKTEDGSKVTTAPTGQAQPKPLETIKFRLAWVYDMAEVGVLVAKEKGYFEKEGLNVVIEPGGFGLDPIKLVAAGSNDYGIGGAGNLLLARAQAVPVVALGAEFQNTPVGFITHKNSGITKFEQFRGKRVGIQTGADTDVLYRALLFKYGMTSKDVKEVPIQYDMSPFVNNLIDVLPGYVTNQPIVLRDKGFETNVITASSQGLNYYGNVFFTSERVLNDRPDQVGRFMRAVTAGWQHALDHKAEAISSLQKYTKEFDPKDLDRIYDAVVPFIRPEEQGVQLLGMTPTRWATTMQVLTDAQLLKDKIDVTKAYTTRYVK